MKIHTRMHDMSTERLEWMASHPSGGSGESAWCSGLIQAMAKEILELRKQSEKETYRE